MIPVRSFAKSQNCKVVWDKQKKTDTIYRNGRLLYTIKIDSDIVTMSEETYKLNNHVEIKKGKIYVEAEFLNFAHEVTIDIDSTDMGFDYKPMQASIKVLSDKMGCAYLIIGTDSGFEGYTEYYIDNVTISLTK